jgi:hypothetical protein
MCSSYLPLGVPNGLYLHAIKQSFLALLLGRKKTSARGVCHAQYFTLVLFCFISCLLASFLSKIQKKLVSFIVAYTCLLLVLLEWVPLRTPSCVILLAPKK